MARTRFAIAAALLALAAVRSAAADPFAEMPFLGDDELGALRGGMIFRFDGLEFRIAFGLETWVDGRLLLRSELGKEDLLHGRGGAGAALPAGLGPRVEIAGDPNGTQVIHQIGANDLAAVVRNRLDGVTIQTNGRMDIEIPNFSARESAIRQGLAIRGLSDLLRDGGARALQH